MLRTAVFFVAARRFFTSALPGLMTAAEITCEIFWPRQKGSVVTLAASAASASALRLASPSLQALPPLGAPRLVGAPLLQARRPPYFVARQHQLPPLLVARLYRT